MRIDIKELEGRDHFVVPTVMITVGVHAGSGGPIYYPPEPLRNTVMLWNGKPVVVYHPNMYNDNFAGNPSVYNRQKIGTVFNARFDGKRLLAEAWIDVQRARQVDRRVLETIHHRRMMEVSTGVIVEPAASGEGIFNGKQYHYAAANLIPDHLAVLPDKKGACSIADGAGLVRNFDRLLDNALPLPVMTFR
jgi:hypothetical protein